MLTLYSRNTVTLGSPGIDDKYGSSVSMRGVVSSTSTNKLTILITGNTNNTCRGNVRNLTPFDAVEGLASISSTPPLVARAA